MSELTIGLLSALLATNQPQAVSNLVQQNTGISITIPNPNDPAEKELQRLMDEDDAARAEIDKWIQDNNAFAKQGAAVPNAELNRRINERLAPVRQGYGNLLQQFPDFARGHLAYGSFLNELGDEEGGAAEYEKAAELDPKNPAAWNNLGNFHGHQGPVTNAFTDYAKAIELNPAEPIYYQNLATTVYLFRKDAMEFYGITEPQVFDKSLALYAKALALKPDDFPLATDLAQSYYGIKPLRTNDALVAWTNALNIAHDDVEREGVFIHLARVKIAVGRYDEARAHLNDVTNAMYDPLKTRLEHNLELREHPPTNAESAEVKMNLPEAATNIVPEPTNAPPAVADAAPVLTNTEIATTNLAEATTNNVVEAAPSTTITNLKPDLSNLVIRSGPVPRNNIVGTIILSNWPVGPTNSASASTNIVKISTNAADTFDKFMMAAPPPRPLPSPPK